MAKRIESHTPKWVEPIIEYQRLADRYQTVEERVENERKKRNDLKRTERRFIALRKLVSTLKKDHSFSRLDYPSADHEIRRLAVERIQNDLADLLTGLELTPAAATEIVRIVLEHSAHFQLTTDHSDRTTGPSAVCQPEPRIKGPQFNGDRHHNPAYRLIVSRFA